MTDKKKFAVTEFTMKQFDRPDESAEFPGMRYDGVCLGDFKIYRMKFEPGWRWTDSLPGVIGTDTCEYEHPVWMVLSGRFAVQMNDGRIHEYRPGDLGMIPPGHDAWVVGDDPVLAIDIQVNTETE